MKQLIHVFNRGGGRGVFKNHKVISKKYTYWVLNRTAHFLWQSQNTSLYLLFLNLWISYCSLLWSFRNTMTLITLQTPTPSQSIKHLLETTLFLKQSNWSQSQINPAVKKHRILNFKGLVCLTTLQRNSHSYCFSPWGNVTRKHSPQKMKEKQALHLRRHMASYCVP